MTNKTSYIFSHKNSRSELLDSSRKLKKQRTPHIVKPQLLSCVTKCLARTPHHHIDIKL